MKTMTMPSVGIKMDFPRDVKAMVEGEKGRTESNFLEQIKSAAKELEKQTSKVKDKSSSAKDTVKKEPVETDDETSEKTEDNKENTNAVAELAAMLTAQEKPVVLDVKQLLMEPSQSEQSSVMAVGEVQDTQNVSGEIKAEFTQAVNNEFVVELERVQAGNTAGTVNLAGIEVNNVELSAEEKVVLAGQQVPKQGAENNAQAPIVNDINEQKTPQIAQSDIGLPKDTYAESDAKATANVTEVSNQEMKTQTPELQDMKTDKADKNTETGAKKSEFNEALNKSELGLGKLQQTEQNNQNADKSSQDEAKSFTETAKQTKSEPRNQSGEEKELFVTDKFRKQMDRLEEVLLQGGMSTAQIKDFKTAELARAASLDNLDMAPQVEQVTGKIFEAMDNGVNELIMQLQPKELGKLMIKLSMENNRLTVNITAENLHAQKAITEQLGLLENSIKSQDVIIDRINVAYDSQNNLNSSYNQNGLGGQFEQRENSKNHQQTNYFGTSEAMGTDEIIDVPKLMIIGNEMLNYVV